MSTQPSNYLTNITNNIGDDYKSYIIMAFTFLILIFIVGYMIYLRRLKSAECNNMNNLYSSLDGNLIPITSNDPDCSGNLYDYYIKTAYNACSGGAYKNDYVDICNLKAIIKQGVRCLDFEIFSNGSTPVVATSTINDNYYVKETFNHVKFSDVMNTISNYAFASGTCPNYTDPLLIHLRINSSRKDIYDNLATIFSSYDSLMLGPEYSFENEGQNLGGMPLLSFQNKIILIVDRINNSFTESQTFLEYVNLTSNSIFMRAYTYYDVKNNPDINELTDYNMTGMTIVFPDGGANPANPSGVLCRAAGCQMVAMRYQYNDNYLTENNQFFDSCGYAFCLKPYNLLYNPVTIQNPTPQNPDYSYQTRTVSTDYYSYNF